MNRLRYDGNHFRRSVTRFFKLTAAGLQRPSQQVHKFSRLAGWTLDDFAPIPQFTGGLASTRGRVHMMGGRTGFPDSNSGSLVHTVFANDSWSVGPDLLPPIRKNNSAAASNGDLYILGGFNGLSEPDSSRRRLDRFSADSQSWSDIDQPYPHDVQNPGFVGHTDYLLAFGGNNFVSSSYYADAHRFTPSTNAWDARQNMATPLGSHAYAGIGPSFSYAMSGYNGVAFTNLTRRYDANTDAWMNLASRPSATYAGSAAMELGGKIVLYSGPESTRPPILHEFDGLSWASMPNVGAPVVIASVPHPQQTVAF